MTWIFYTPIVVAMKTPAEIIDSFGSAKVASATGAALSRVIRVRNEKHIPPSWFDALEKLSGKPLPREVFGFKYGQQEVAE